MADPQAKISWWTYTPDGSNIVELNKWSLGIVEAAGNPELTRTTFILWSNKGGSTGLPTLRDCRIGTRDYTGGFNHPLVKERWIIGTFNSSDTPIGAEQINGEWVPKEMPIQAMGAVETGTIESGPNDGTMGSANAKNYAIFDLRMQVPASASAGPVQANLRLGFTIS